MGIADLDAVCYPFEEYVAGPFAVRTSVEGGISWHGFGLWAGYGLTPAFRGSNARTLSFGLVIGI